MECQRIGWLQGWELICCQSTAAPEQPAYALFATDVALHLKEAAKKKRRFVEERSLQHGLGKASNSKLASDAESLNGSKRKTIHNKRKEAALVIRGTYSIHDVVTDIRATPAEFPPDDADMDQSSKSQRVR